MAEDGVWAVQTGEDARFENMTAGGIVVLQAGRVFGGDQRVAVTGSYSVDGGDTLDAALRIWTWNPAFAAYTQAYGLVGPFELDVQASCRLDGGRWLGHSWVASRADAVRQSLVLTKMTELP